jgi:hypothetical protein
MSESKNKIKLFEDKQVRFEWDEQAEKWWFSVVDVIAVLTDSDNPRRYWSDLKRKLKAEGSQLYENIVQLKMPSADGKNYLTDVADTEQVLRLVQSVPSPKAEPFKALSRHRNNAFYPDKNIIPIKLKDRWKYPVGIGFSACFQLGTSE